MRHLPSGLVKTAMLFTLLISACGPNQQPAAPPVPAGHVKVQNDVLHKYPLAKLTEILRNRSNKTAYTSEPADVKGVPTPTLSDHIIMRQKSIYGPDRRKEIFEIQDSNALQAANSVAAIIPPAYFQQTNHGLEISQKTFGHVFSLCSGQSFFSEPVAPGCSAFVVKDDVIATAAHCVKMLGTSRIVFGFRAEKHDDQVRYNTLIPDSQVYRAVQVLAQQQSGGVDYALVKVDRPIVDHPPLRLHTDGDVSVGSFVYVLGHPSGLPLKMADGAVVSQVTPNGYFLSNLDTFGGNSGSPVLNPVSNLVEGILVRGAPDFEQVETCQKAFVCPEEPDDTKKCLGESSTLISKVLPALEANENNIAKLAPAMAPIVKTFRSGERLSGSGANFSGVYELDSEPPPPGYKIGNFVYSLAGDRGCNAWSTCSASSDGTTVVFRFSLQGHNEWAPPGQAKSEGFLTVTYVPAN
jgi:S1-C subfamily serine protease